MNSKWYFGTIIFILTLFVVNQQQVSIPNQEIVIQFSSDEIRLIETQHTIAILKKQLQQVGIEKIKVHKGAHGELKISYYSKVDVASIKKIFSEENELNLGISSIFNDKETTNFPSKNKSNNYQLDVYEIQKADDAELDLNGFAIELKSDYDRFFTPVVYFFKNKTVNCNKNKVEKVSFKIYKLIANEIDNSSHNIPEVRAGPFQV